MFSGIIQATARVKAVEEAKKIKRVRIEAPRGWKLSLGASVNIDGVCSTVVKKGAGYFDVEYMPETLSKTTVGTFTRGTLVNMERSLKLGDTLDGHFVSGHVDATAKVSKTEARGTSINLSVELPRHLLTFVSLQGSITINGVALTVSRLKGATATVSLIPYTLTHTNLGNLKKGARVNIEVDLLARYVARLVKK